MMVKIRMVEAARKLLGGAVGVLSAARAAARHAAWYVRHHVEGAARDDERNGRG